MNKTLACFFAALALPAFAGQSIQYGPQTISNTAIRLTINNRVEFRIHDWTPNSYTHLIAGTGVWPTYQGATGWVAYLANQTGVGEGVSLRNTWDDGLGSFIPVDGMTDVSVRAQHNVIAKADEYEGWSNGSRFYAVSVPYTTETNTGSGLVMGYGNEPVVNVAFMRVLSTLVPMNSRAPVTFSQDASCVFEWKFEGDLSDSCGGNYPANYAYGSPGVFIPTYVPTPVLAPYASIKSNWRSWADVTTARAGFPMPLDGTSSYSQSDTSAAVTWAWKQLSGPSRLFWDSLTSGTPAPTGVIFGDYRIALTVCDNTSACTTTAVDVGAVAQDSKGIVIPADPNVTALYGDMMTWGKIPWGSADRLNKRALDLRVPAYQAAGWLGNSSRWEKVGAGTVSYTWDGTGTPLGDKSCPNGLAADVPAGSMFVVVTNAACIDLSTLPTRILLFNGGAETEVRICAQTIPTPNILAICAGSEPAAAWSAGSMVGQFKVTGVGTDFLNDPNAAVCPKGASPGAAARIDLRANLTVDTAGIGEWFWFVTGCESPTTLYIDPVNGAHDITLLDALPQTGRQYSFDANAANEGFFANAAIAGTFFYAENTMARSLYFRSGLDEAKNAADLIDCCLLNSPWGNPIGNGYAPLVTGGPVIGSFFAAILGSDGAPSWASLRSYAEQGEEYVNTTATSGCNVYDQRNTGYAYEWVGYAGTYDPDPIWRARWQKDIVQMAANDAACKTADNSFTNSYLFNPSGSRGGGLGYNGGFGPLTLTNGSTTVSAPGGLPAAACIGTAQGFATVVHGSSVITVTAGSTPFPSSGFDALTLAGVSGGAPFASQFMAANGNLAVLWPYDSGTVSWMSTSTNNGSTNMLTFGTDNNDTANLSHGFNCIANADGTLTLDHAWPGATGSTYVGNLSNVVGTGVQPFYLGVRALGTGFLSRVTDPALAAVASFYQKLSSGIAHWLHDVGTDIASLTTNYGVGYQLCSPVNPPSSSASFSAKSPGCNYTTGSKDSMSVGREQNAEIANAISELYIASPTAANLAWGDQMYGAVFGNPAFDAAGAYSDPASDATNLAPTNLSDASLANGKWPGFFFGMGAAWRWPAVRLGGVDPPDPATVMIPFTVEETGAAQAQVTITAATGKAVTTVCPVSPCEVSVDRRSGSVLMELDYLDASGAVMMPGENVPLYVTSP